MPFTPDGNLPPGVHSATWAEVVARFGGTVRRIELLAGLRLALVALREAGCGLAYVDGRFVSDVPEPNDFDGCWEPEGVDLRKLDPTLYDFPHGRRA